MAIELTFLNVFKQVVELKKKNNLEKRLTALCLAYPDLLVPKQALIDLFSQELVDTLPVMNDADEIWKWHGLSGCQDPLYDTAALFNALNIDLDVIDIVAARGNERIVDLNDPLPIDLHARFDLVIDTGTCEHCFNVGQAFMNSCLAVAHDGFLIHAAPMSKCNHGFWNFCPTVYPDFFGDNGFNLLAMTGAVGALVDGVKTFEISPFARVSLPSESFVIVVAQRIEIKKMRWPMQRKYRTA